MTEYVRNMEQEKAYGVSNMRGILNALGLAAAFWAVVGVGIFFITV